MRAPALWTPYCGVAPQIGEWRWNLDPVLLAALGLAAVVIGARLEGRRRGLGIAAMAVLAVGFVSPLCALSSALFSARTIHHVLLVGVAAPLLASMLPVRRAGSLILATAVQAVVLWAWHAPDAYASALSNDGVYWVMQASLLASAVWFWCAVRSATPPAAVVALLATMLAMGLLGAVLTFAGQAVYAPHAYTTLAWGLTPLEDQQAAGLIMWAPAAALYLFAALWRLGRMIGSDVEARPA
ncbi:cytochrome c oxidase assembly protein [Brevundimonas sp. SORGH_AS_0993]|uniref:cytochrome c oxidase assembly protein n=1 Tax=Brevundimonas sp. SORGH_AS_0993 TaxID=3041794 RepID=UPI00277D8193|nr:cytochrome c oxidase assembly protein [Brevundimonas sp. SORGH_AS_0993]MDQ1154176.1 putative membrane protein [Brevundimonas sp. SORGH_AS_0993]